MARELNIKQQRFIEYYLESGNGSEALTKAGYQTQYPDKYASELLAKPHVKAVLEKTRAEMNRKAKVTLDDKITLLWQIANDPCVATDDKIKAVEVLNKMQGHNAPEKSSVSVNVSVAEDMELARSKYLVTYQQPTVIDCEPLQKESEQPKEAKPKDKRLVTYDHKH